MPSVRTPAGKECKYFFGDYYRGRQREECRLIDSPGSSRQWTRDLCNTCPVPDILAANACPNLELNGEVFRQFVLFGRKVRVSAHCNKTGRKVTEPHIGCGECHPLPDIFNIDIPSPTKDES